MPKKRWLLVWVGIGVLFVGPPAVLLTWNHYKPYQRFQADAWVLSQPALAVPADDVESVLEDGPIGVVQPFTGLGAIGAAVQLVAVSPDGRWAWCGIANWTPHWMDLQTRNSLGVMQNGWGPWAVGFSPDGKRAITARGGLIEYDTTTRPLPLMMGTIPSGEYNLSCMAIAPNGYTVATGGRARSVQIWNLKTNQFLGSLVPHKSNSSGPSLTRRVAYSADGTQLFSISDDGELYGWDIRTGNLLFSHAVYEGQVMSAAFSGDAKFLLVGGDDKTARLWDIEKQAMRWQSKEHGGPVQHAGFSRDGRRMLTHGGDELLLWDTATGHKLSSVSISGLGAFSTNISRGCVALHPDGRHVIVGGDKPGIVTMLAGGATTRAAGDR